MSLKHFFTCMALATLFAAAPAFAAPFGYIADRLPNRIAVVDLATHSLEAELTPGFIALGQPAVTPDGTRLYIATIVPRQVVVIDTEVGSPTVNTVIDTVSIADVPHGVAMAADGSRAYVTVTDGGPNGRVEVIDTRLGSPTYHTFLETEKIGLTTAPLSPEKLEVTPDGRHLYVGSRQIDLLRGGAFDYVSVFDLLTAQEVGAVKIPLGGRWTRFAFGPGGTRCYVARWSLNEVLVIEGPPNFRIVDRFSLSTDMPSDPVLSPDGSTLYVSDSDADLVTKIDVDPASPDYGGVETLAVGPNPPRLAFAPDALELYVVSDGHIHFAHGASVNES